MRLARVDHGLKLRVGQKAIAQDDGWKLGPVAGFRRSDRSHGRRLHQLGRVRFRSGNVDRLQAEGLINGI